MVAAFLFWLTGFLPLMTICDNGRPYLERYYLWTFRGKRYYIHRFVGSDPDRALHSHPWRWAISFVLKGYYWEENSYGFKLVRWFNFLVGDSFHRVVLFNDTPEVWTLFIHTADREKPWGFAEKYFGDVELVDSYFFRPHKSSGQDKWWTTNPRGKDSVRVPCAS